MRHLLGYVRVSTSDQQPYLHVDALKAAGCYRVFTETASGVRIDRPTFERVLDHFDPAALCSVTNQEASSSKLHEQGHAR